MIAKRRRAMLGVAFVVVATLLPMYFLQYRWERYHCVADVCDFRGEALWIGKTVTFFSRPHPLLNARTHKVVLVDGRPTMVRSVYDGATGVFARAGVPVTMAWIGGVFVPLGMLGCAMVLFMRHDQPAARAAVVAEGKAK